MSPYSDLIFRTDKKQHFSEKVTKVESILAADGTKAEKKVVTVDAPAEGEASNSTQQQSEGPGANKGTWASMFRK
jgi:hypothetical protein